MAKDEEGKVTRLRAVCVDDSTIMLYLLKRMVEECGHEVVGIGTNGIQAQKLCAELKPDVIFLDIAMPFCDGETAASEIVKLPNPPKIIYVTNQGRETTRARASAIHAGMVVKPYVKERIAAEIEKTWQA